MSQTLVKLKRVASSEKGTFGVLHRNNVPICVTLELPWKNNKRNVSCIPAGTYNVIKYNSVKYPDVWQLMDVKDRSYILIHQGNYLEDTAGCILVGSAFSYGDINNSRLAMQKLRRSLPYEFTLEVE